MELNKRQIKAIEWDIMQNGIYHSSLREDVLDHICCLMEQELKLTPDFKTAYLKVRKQMGSLRTLQYNTDEEVHSHKRLERFVKIPYYLCILMYFFLGTIMVCLPIVLSLAYMNVLILLGGSPLLILGYIIIFKRIDYKKLDIIPYKESFSPVKMTF
ncbi:MAG TPA: hypothetical protein VN026_06240 [Bacteroidia bacterium]|jgi:hypothetical protein|nr:hypothetical protein [Bacteroidia bacterium]